MEGWSSGGRSPKAFDERERERERERDTRFPSSLQVHYSLEKNTSDCCMLGIIKKSREEHTSMQNRERRVLVTHANL
jgi:hypothetical protein